MGATRSVPFVQTFLARAVRHEGGWSAVVDGLDIKCQGRRLDRLASAVKASIVALTDLDEEDFEVTMAMDQEPLIADVVNDFRHYQAALADAQAEYNAALRRAITRLTSETLSDRDMSFLLGLSHQRIAQVRVAS